jgi:histidyl-tRNA synthetase
VVVQHFDFLPSGAQYALIVGEAEVAARKVGVKPLRVAGEQQMLAADAVAALLSGHC